MSSLANGPRMMSNKTKSISMKQHLPLISCISAISLITITLLSGHGIGFATAAKEVATNTFYVKITPDAANSHQDPNEVAHKIARRNGFHNLGPVRLHFLSLDVYRNSNSLFPNFFYGKKIYLMFFFTQNVL